jgi:hypothetical protein
VPEHKLTACLTVALLLRLAFVFVGFPFLEQRWQLREDGDGYGVIAQTIRDSHYDDVTRGPVYPFFVAAAGSTLTVKVLQALLDTATCLLIFWLAQRNLWAAWLWAVYPFAFWRVAFINKEVVLAFLLAAYVCFQLRAVKSWQWVAAGVLLGLVNLCKPSFLLWPVVLLAFAPRRAWLTIAAMVIVIAPWTYRNWRVTGGEFLPVATERGGVTTFIGNYQPTLGLWEGPGKLIWMAAVDEIELQHPNASPVQLDRIFYREAAKSWRNPVTATALVIRKCGRFWFLSAKRRVQLLSVAIQGGYLALLGIGLWRTRPLSRETKLMLALIGYVMLVHALSYADLRFSLPVMPLVCVIAARTFARASTATRTS